MQKKFILFFSQGFFCLVLDVRVYETRKWPMICVALMSKECWVKPDDWPDKVPLFGSRKTVTLERRLIQITNLKRATSLCNSGVISNIKWDNQFQYLEWLLCFIFIRHRLTLVHFLCSVCEIYVVISSYICITRIPVLPHELYPFRSFYSSWIKGYTGNLGRSELNWIDVSRKWLNNPKIVQSWRERKKEIEPCAYGLELAINKLKWIKSGCQRKPGKVLKMSTEGGQQNKFILTS